MLFFYQIKQTSEYYQWKLQWARSQWHCLRNLVKKGHYPYRLFSLQSLFNKKLFKQPEKLQYKHWIYFFEKLSTHLHSGKNLANALKALRSNIHIEAQKKFIEEALEHLSNGRYLYSVLQDPQYHFSQHQIKLLKCAEMSGYLIQGIDRIHEQLRLKDKIRKQLHQNLIYPCCVLSFTICFCFLLVFFLVPRFQEFFIQQGLPLKGWVGFIFSFNHLLPKILPWLALLGLGSLTLFKYQKKHFKYLLETWFYKFFIPLYYSSFAVNLAELLEQNISLIEALKLSLPHLPNRYSSEEITFALQQGITLSHALKGLPVDFIQTLQSAEINSELAKNLRNLSTIYYQNYENKLLQLVKWIEPACLLFLACFVFIIVCSLFYPLIQLFQGIDFTSM